jgi:pyruvate kinase
MGPATNSVDMLRSLIRKGMNLARFNFSHGDYTSHGAMIALVREAALAEEVEIPLMLDTKGPEIRTGLTEGDVTLENGETLEVLAEADASLLYGPGGEQTRKGRITLSYAAIADDVRVGARILIGDGLLGLRVKAVEGRIIRAVVEAGGSLGSRKNVNVLGVHTRLPAMGEKDMDDLRFGVEQGMDMVSASFIRKPSDVTTIQKYLHSLGSDMPVIAKIEDDEGLSNIEEIIRVSGGIMVARGDLGVQIPPEQVPIAQKRIIRLCNLAGKPVITATQMLDSMIHNPRPTRAEAADVANAILDGTDCIMLSGETASGTYPEEAVAVMDRIARAAEASETNERRNERRRMADTADDMNSIVAAAAAQTADKIGAACIITPTMSGNTARLLSKSKPRHAIITASPNAVVRRRAYLNWGTVPVAVPEETDSEAMIQRAIAAAIKKGFAKAGDKVVVVAGLPLFSPLTANNIRVHVIGAVLGRGDRGFGGRCTGRIFKVRNQEEAALVLRQGERDGERGGERGGAEILLTHTLDESMLPLLKKVQGLILEGASDISYDLMRESNPGLVCVAAVPKAIQTFEDSAIVTLDGAERLIYNGTL